MDGNDRSKRVLAALVREYIASGEPVASSLLVTAAGLGVSSATVRNMLARLEDEGIVQQPHTSAGRIPTDRGYRFYVDLLLESEAARAGAATGRGAAAARRLRRHDRLGAAAGVARRVAGVAQRRLCRAAGATKRRSSIASSSCRSARRACWWSSSPAAGTSSRRSSTSTNRSTPTICGRRPTT